MNFIFATGEHSFLTQSEQIEELKESPFNMFCFRLPDYSEEHIELEAWKCRWATNMLNAKYFIFSNSDLVNHVGADGIILKKDDLPPMVVRAEIGKSKLIIGQASNLEDAINFVIEGADVLMLGPLHSKELGKELGIEGLKNIISTLKDNDLDVPIWVYGGITPQISKKIESLHIDAIAVTSYILNSDDIVVQANDFK